MDNHGDRKPKLHEIIAATEYNNRLKPPVIKIIEKAKRIPVIGSMVNALQDINLDIAEQSALSGSEIDTLTGLNNRAGLGTRIYQLYHTLRRAAENPDNLKEMRLAVYFIDVNKLKAFNDKYGHPAGDELLKGVATVLKNSSRRPEDIIARAGGDEYVVVGERESTTQDDQDEIVERMFEKMDSFRKEFEKKYPNLPEGTVTLAVGRAVYTLEEIDMLIKDNPGLNLADLILPRADQSMYKAKGEAHTTKGNGFTKFARVS